MNTCPCCGYCPHCGRRNAQPNPFYQTPFPYTIWQGTYGGTPNIGQATGGISGNLGFAGTYQQGEN